MKGYIILLNGNITFFGLTWLVLIFCSFDAIDEGEKLASEPNAKTYSVPQELWDELGISASSFSRISDEKH